jgi:hypothetical protein
MEGIKGTMSREECRKGWGKEYRKGKERTGQDLAKGGGGLISDRYVLTSAHPF